VLIVRPGVWVLCGAGWGRVERIEDGDGQQVERFFYTQTGYRLSVTLRPSVDSEPIIVDQVAGQISFPKAKHLYTCSKCEAFTAQDPHVIVSGHNHVSHGNVGPAVRRESKLLRSLETLTYYARAPKDQLDIPSLTEAGSQSR
jgi:hypothetical protein